MFSNLPTFFRLALCLLLSAGVHGGVASYGWMKSPVESRVAHAPVVVSLRPATDAASPVATKRTQHEPVPVLTSTKSRPVDAKLASAVTRPSAAAPRRAPSKVLPGTLLPVTVDEPKNETNQTISSAETVCALPQDPVLDSVPVPPGISQPDIEPVGTGTPFVKAVNEAPPALTQGDERGLPNTAASVSQALTEATPDYSSNPLPKYPRLARQKHWEGVVWLMVDVSAAGLVDDLRIEQSCGHRVLDRAAHRAVSRWRFSPAKRDGLPVSSQVRIPVRFLLEEG